MCNQTSPSIQAIEPGLYPDDLHALLKEISRSCPSSNPRPSLLHHFSADLPGSNTSTWENSSFLDLHSTPTDNPTSTTHTCRFRSTHASPRFGFPDPNSPRGPAPSLAKISGSGRQCPLLDPVPYPWLLLIKWRGRRIHFQRTKVLIVGCVFEGRSLGKWHVGRLVEEIFKFPWG